MALTAAQKARVASAGPNNKQKVRQRLRDRNRTQTQARASRPNPVLPVPNNQPTSPLPQPDPPPVADDRGLQPTNRFQFDKTPFDGSAIAAGQERQDARVQFNAAENARREAERTAFQGQRQADRRAEAGRIPQVTFDIGSTGNVRDTIMTQEIWDALFVAQGHDEAKTIQNNPEIVQQFLRLNQHQRDAGIGDTRLISQLRRMLSRHGAEAIRPGEWNAYTPDGQAFDFRSQGGGVGTGGAPGGGAAAAIDVGGGPPGMQTGGGSPPMAGLPPPAGNVPPIGTDGVTSQGDEFNFENDPILGGRIDDLLQGMEGVQESEMRGMVGDALSGILMQDPNADPNVVLDRLANVREQMIPLRESAKQRISTDLARMGLADSPAVMAQALAGVESEINNQITQQWRDIVNEEQARAQEQFQQGIGLGMDQEQSDRNFKIQQMDQALQRAGIEAQERLDLIRLANDARQVFNSGRQIDANIALDNLRFNLDFQNFLHNQGMDLAQFQLTVEQARMGNALELQRLLLGYMGEVDQGFV